MLIPSSGFEAAAATQASAELDLDLSFHSSNYHSRLFLPESYDSFLQALGRNTRHNFRRYRARFEFEGGRYEADVPMPSFAQAAFGFNGRSSVIARTDSVLRAVRVLQTVERPFLSALRNRQGEWLGVLGGFYGPESTVTLFMQLNSDRVHAKDSLSQVLRGYAIETLIKQGVRQVRFWSGTSNPLGRYTEWMSSVTASLDSRKPLWRNFRRVSLQAAKYFPSLLSTDFFAVSSAPLQAHADD